ncbi:hypothetical protein V8F33_000282 [Rhypophila sp. PSN 637]
MYVRALAGVICAATLINALSLTVGYIPVYVSTSPWWIVHYIVCTAGGKIIRITCLWNWHIRVLDTPVVLHSISMRSVAYIHRVPYLPALRLMVQ